MSHGDEIDELNESIQKLRVSYEQYFAGVDRNAPLKDRGVIKKALRRLLTARSNNTAYKFRVQSAQATMVTYENYWDRITRQIEEGTFKRDKLRAQKMLAERPKEAEAPKAAGSAAQPAAQGAAAPAPAGQTPASPASGGAPAAYPESLRKLHEAYVQTRAQLGETRPIAIDNLAETIRKQIAAVKAQYKCERVEFKVAVKDGKAILKAIPK